MTVLGLSGIIVFGGQFNDESSKVASETTMKERTELVSIDPEDPVAMARWAHGVCRGQTINGLAEFYGVDAKMEAVIAKIIQDLPGKTRQLVANICRDELSKTSRRAS